MDMLTDWLPLGNKLFYQKIELYHMVWRGGINLKDLLVAAAPFGGPIALAKDEERNAVGQSKKLVSIYSSSGNKISSFKTGGKVITLDWSCEEELVCVEYDGTVIVYDIFGNCIRTCSTSQEIKDSLPTHVQLHKNFDKTGIIFLTKSNQIFYVDDIKHFKVRKMSAPFLSQGGSVSSWCSLLEMNDTKVIVSHNTNIYSVNQSGSHQIELQWPGSGEAIVDMCASSHLHYIALYSESSWLWLGSSDFNTKFCEYQCQKRGPPSQFKWCGNTAVCMLFNHSLDLINMNGDTMTIQLDDPASYLIQEVDCVRILNSTSQDLLTRVPSVTVETLGLGSMSAGAFLFEASQGFQEGSTRSIDCLSMIENSIEEGVTQCLQSAQHSFSTSIQKALLKAAFFGKTFLADTELQSLQKISNMLRILNCVRQEKVGIPLTWCQLEAMSVSVLLERLISRRLYPLALKIVSYLKLPAEETAKISSHWALYKINKRSTKSDHELALEISSKLGQNSGISYAEISKAASEIGKKGLAVKLTDFECHVHQQVDTLLGLEQYQSSLQKAMQSGDTDLILSVLKHMKNKTSLAQFLINVRKFPEALNLYSSMCKETDEEQFKDLLIQEDNYYEQAMLKVNEAYSDKFYDNQMALFQGSSDYFTRAKNDWATHMTNDQMKLIRYQITFSTAHQESFDGLTIQETVLNLLQRKAFKDADKLKSDFKIPEKKFQKLKALAAGE